MNDETIHEIAAKIDTTIMNLCVEHSASPLALSGIILARLTWLNDMVDDGKDFRDLCKFISDRPKITSIDRMYPEPNDLAQAQELLRRFNINNDGDKQ